MAIGPVSTGTAAMMTAEGAGGKGTRGRDVRRENSRHASGGPNGTKGARRGDTGMQAAMRTTTRDDTIGTATTGGRMATITKVTGQRTATTSNVARGTPFTATASRKHVSTRRLPPPSKHAGKAGTAAA